MAGNLKTYLYLLSPFLLACGTGIGHHLFYTFLNGKPVEHQTWMTRAGTAIAYFAKIFFVASVGTAFTQQIWRSMRSKFYTLGAIDNLFDLKNDPLRFFSWEILTKAKLPLVLAISLWAFPLLPIFAPGSISITNVETLAQVSRIPTQTLNFSRSHDTTSRRIDDYTVNLFEIPGIGANAQVYSGPAPRANGLVYSTVYGGQILSTASPCGANCTFRQSFVGPAYKCRDVDYAKVEPGNPFCYDRGTRISCEDIFASPRSNAFERTWYLARNSSGTCASCYDSSGGWMDGKIWVAYQYLLPEYRLPDPNYGDANATFIPEEAWERHQFVCESWNATFDIERSYVNSLQTITRNTTFLYPLKYDKDSIRSSSITPSYAGYTIHQLMYSILSGIIGLNGRMVPIDETGLGGTRLVEEKPFPPSNSTYTGLNGIQKPIRNLRASIEDLHFNITISMLSIPQLIYLQDEIVAASLKAYVNHWSYDWIPLAASYCACAFINLCAIFVAVGAIWDNRGVGVLESGFLKILMTTRNRTFDVLVGDRGRGDDEMQREVKDTEVKLGMLVHRSGRQGAAYGFGVKGEIESLHGKY